MELPYVEFYQNTLKDSKNIMTDVFIYSLYLTKSSTIS
jgi:hypothetical protein